MRQPRRFRPAFDSLQFRVVPSALAPAPSGSVATTADITGSPGEEPSGDEIYPIIMTPVVGSTSTSTIC